MFPRSSALVVAESEIRQRPYVRTQISLIRELKLPHSFDAQGEALGDSKLSGLWPDNLTVDLASLNLQINFPKEN